MCLQTDPDAGVERGAGGEREGGAAGGQRDHHGPRQGTHSCQQGYHRIIESSQQSYLTFCI